MASGSVPCGFVRAQWLQQTGCFAKLEGKTSLRTKLGLLHSWHLICRIVGHQQKHIGSTHQIYSNCSGSIPRYPKDRKTQLKPKKMEVGGFHPPKCTPKPHHQSHQKAVKLTKNIQKPQFSAPLIKFSSYRTFKHLRPLLTSQKPPTELKQINEDCNSSLRLGAGFRGGPSPKQDVEKKPT